MSELLLETRLDPEQTEFARAVRNNADALGMLIGDLLDSSRIEAGQVFLEAAPFDLRELLGDDDEVASHFRTRGDRSGPDRAEPAGRRRGSTWRGFPPGRRPRSPRGGSALWCLDR